MQLTIQGKKMKWTVDEKKIVISAKGITKVVPTCKIKELIAVAPVGLAEGFIGIVLTSPCANSMLFSSKLNVTDAVRKSDESICLESGEFENATKIFDILYG